MPTPTVEPKAGATQAAIQKEISDAKLKAASSKPVTETASDFMQRFSGQPNPDGTISQGKPVEGSEDDDGGLTPPARQEPRSEAPSAKKPSYVKTLEAEKEQIAKERDALTEKIKGFEQQLASAKKPEEIDALLKERDTAIADRESQLKKLSEEVSTLKNKVTLYDLTEDPDFIQTYVEPINRASVEVMEIIEGNQPLIDKLTQVATLNNAWLSAGNDMEKRRRFQDQRDMLIGEISEEVPTFRKDMFLSSMRDMISLSRKRADAINNHAETFSRIQENRKSIQAEAARKTAEVWNGAFSEVSTTIESEIAPPETVRTFMETNKISDDNAIDENIASSAIKDGAKDYQPKDVARILKQGAAYKKLKAQNEALLKMLAEKDETLKELRGAGTSGEMTAGSKKTETAEEGLSSFFGRFKAPQ